MPRQSRALPAVALLLTALAAQLLAPVGAAATTTPVDTLLDGKVLSPVAGEVVRGDIDVRVQVWVPEAQDATVQVYASGGVTAIAASSDLVAVPAGGCEPSCELTIPLSTVPAMATWSAGSRSIGVRVRTADGRTSNRSVTVQQAGAWPMLHLRTGTATTKDWASGRTIDHDMDLTVRLPEWSARDAVRVVVVADGEDVVLDRDLPVQPSGAGTVEARLPVGPGSELGTGAFSVRVAGRTGGSFTQVGTFWLQVVQTTPVTWSGWEGTDVVEGHDLPLLTWQTSGSSLEQVQTLRPTISVDGAAPRAVYQPPVTVLDRATAVATSTAWGTLQPTRTGVHRWTYQLRDADGLPWGAPFEVTRDVTGFAFTASAPPLVVGRPAVVAVSATSPTAEPLRSCLLGLGEYVLASDDYCAGKPAARSQSGRITFVPTVSGASRLIHQADTAGHRAERVVPVTVYPARAASVAAPDLPFGSRGTIKVTLRDTVQTGRPLVPVRNAVVTLQRQRIDSSTWVTYGRYPVGTDGSAYVPFRADSDARWRALTPTPYGDVVSPVDVSRANAAVTWTAAPTSARIGATMTFRATVAPYQPGSVAQLQVRNASSSLNTWNGVATVAVPSTGAVQVRVRPPGGGTYQYRWVRPGRTIISTGTSAVRTVQVR